MLGKLKSDRLGGFLGVSQTLKLGADKRLGNRIFLSSSLSVFMIIFYYRYGIFPDYLPSTQQRDIQTY